MKAKGSSGSCLFSARLKCTRPTRFQAGLNPLRKVWRSAPDRTRDAANAAPSSSHSASRTSAFRYSAPGIIGAVSTRVAISPSVGGGTTGKTGDDGASEAAPGASRHSAPTYRAAKSRHQTKAGGKAWPTSPAPSCRRPCPVPRGKGSGEPLRDPVVQDGSVVGRLEQDVPLRRQA